MSFEWFGHDVLLRELVVEAVVENVEPLRVGAGKAAAMFEPVDLVVLKVRDKSGREVPVVPGSSWKGAFRANSVRHARGAGLAVCDGVPDATHLKGNEFYELERERAGRSKMLSAILDGWVKLCLTCAIYGAPSFLSHVFLGDSTPKDTFSLGTRTMVAIDRRSGAAARRALFTVEYIEPGTRFSFYMRASNLPNYALGLLAENLLDLDRGVLRVGGLKSRGFGKVEFRELKIKVWEREPEGDLLKPLDPIDSGVPLKNWELSDERAWSLVKELAHTWRESLDKLRKVSAEGWRWRAAES